MNEMEHAAYRQGVWDGEDAERERIIALLEAESDCFHVNPVVTLDERVCYCEAIATIKGETK